jgi:SAM-dependent methyltransferase
MSFLAKLDHYLFRYVGYPYMRATRDDSSFERVFYLLRFLKEQNRPVRVLDAGCSGAIALYLIEREMPNLVQEYVGLDWKASRLYDRYKHFKTQHQFFDTNLDDDWNIGEFDVVWCSECLEHIIDDHGVFKKLCRSVRPGGHIVLSMPSEAHLKGLAKAMPELVETSSTQNGCHVRVGYTPESLRDLAEGTNAELLRVDAITRADETYIYRRYHWGPPLQSFRKVYYTLTRSTEDSYKIAATPNDLERFQSIASVYRVG